MRFAGFSDFSMPVTIEDLERTFNHVRAEALALDWNDERDYRRVQELCHQAATLRRAIYERMTNQEGRP